MPLTCSARGLGITVRARTDTSLADSSHGTMNWTDSACLPEFVRAPAAGTPPSSPPRADTPLPPLHGTAVQRVSNSDRGKQLAAATLGYTSAALAASELFSKLTMDANLFINAEADAPIPDSIRQVVRLVNTPELEECAQRVSSGVARGMAGAASAVMGGSGDGGESNSSGPSAAERLLDKLLDPRNWGVVSVVVGTTTRQTLELLIEVWRESNRNAQAEAAGSETIDEDGNVQQTPQTAPSGLEHFLEKALHLAASEDGKSVLLDVCSTFVENAVGTYLEKTAGSNTFDDFFAAALAASNREGTAVGAFPNPGTVCRLSRVITHTSHGKTDPFLFYNQRLETSLGGSPAKPCGRW